MASSQIYTCFFVALSLWLMLHLNHQVSAGDEHTSKLDHLDTLFRPDNSFKPLYKGEIVTRKKLNLTDSAKKVILEPDYYKPNEGPEDEDDEEEEEEIDLSSVSSSSVQPTLISSSTTVRSTTTSTTSTTPRVYTTSQVSELFKPDSDFKPFYKGKHLPREKLNLTDGARKVYLQPDYYKPGEGPEDDEEEAEVHDDRPQSSSTSVSTLSTSTVTESSVIDSNSIPRVTPTGSSTLVTLRPIPAENLDLFKPDKDFKPFFKGKHIPRHELNLTDGAKKVYLPPDYYAPGEGPEDEEEDEENETKKEETNTNVAETSALPPSISSTEATHTIPSDNLERKAIATKDLFKFDNDFKPLYKGQFVPRHKLNLTDAAKKVYIEPDYYEEGEGPEDEEDDTVLEGIQSSSTEAPKQTRSSTTTRKTTTYASNNFDDTEEQDDIDLAVGGISGVVEKILHGPKSNEINEKSSPEEVYVYISNIVRDESAKAFKATLPRIYDYQYPIGELVSQRCFNSFAQFGDRLRKGYIWPMKMLAASASMGFTHFALRDYGDFDHCLNIVADDDERRPQEQFFTGQYCMMHLDLPLPNVNANVTYKDKILHFNDTELSGTFAEFVSLNAPFLYSNPMSMGVCVPSTCMPSEIEDVLHFFLRKFHIKVHFGLDCYSQVNLTVNHLPGELLDMNLTTLLQNEKAGWLMIPLEKLSSLQFWTIIYILASVTVVALATIYEIRKTSQKGSRGWLSSERNRPKSFIACFSARYNLQQIAYVKERHMCEMAIKPENHSESDTELSPKAYSFGLTIDTSVVDGLKSLSLFWICIANFYLLGYQPQMMPSVAYIRELIIDMQKSTLFTLVTQSLLSMEIFFCLSGFLLAYTSLPYIARHDGRPNLMFFVLKRVIRFLPSLLLLLLIIFLLPLWRNAGPLYKSSVEQLIAPCRRYQWRNLFFASNFYRADQTCLPYLWYISMEFQLSLCGLFITVFAFNRRKHAWKAFILMCLIGIVTSGYSAIVRKLNINTPIFNSALLQEIPDIIKDIYFTTPVHFTSYFFGIAIGYYARMYNSRHFIIPKPVRSVLWVVLPLLSLLALYIPQFWPFKVNFKHARTMTAMYYAVSRIAFVSPFAWLLFECLHHRAVVFTSLFASPVFRLISQLSYQIYLLNMVVIWIYLFTRRYLIETSLFDTFAIACSLFVLTIILSMITYLLFEAPYRSLFRYYFESPRMLSLILPMDQNNNGKGDCSRGGYQKELNMNPNFLFSPHYNLVTNISRAESEASSLANFSMSNTNHVTPSNNSTITPNCALPKSISSVSMAPSVIDVEKDFNKRPNEVY